MCVCVCDTFPSASVTATLANGTATVTTASLRCQPRPFATTTTAVRPAASAACTLLAFADTGAPPASADTALVATSMAMSRTAARRWSESATTGGKDVPVMASWCCDTDTVCAVRFRHDMPSGHADGLTPLTDAAASRAEAAVKACSAWRTAPLSSGRDE